MINRIQEEKLINKVFEAIDFLKTKKSFVIDRQEYKNNCFTVSGEINGELTKDELLDFTSILHSSNLRYSYKIVAKYLWGINSGIEDQDVRRITEFSFYEK